MSFQELIWVFWVRIKKVLGKIKTWTLQNFTFLIVGGGGKFTPVNHRSEIKTGEPNRVNTTDLHIGKELLSINNSRSTFSFHVFIGSLSKF